MLHPSIGFAITDYPTSMVTNAIMLDADVVVGAGLGAAMLIAYNGVWSFEFTFGLGVGAGAGLSYCDTVAAVNSQRPTPCKLGPILSPVEVKIHDFVSHTHFSPNTETLCKSIGVSKLES